MLRFFDRYGYPDALIVVVSGADAPTRQRVVDDLADGYEAIPELKGRVLGRVDVDDVAELVFLFDPSALSKMRERFSGDPADAIEGGLPAWVDALRGPLDAAIDGTSGQTMSEKGGGSGLSRHGLDPPRARHQARGRRRARRASRARRAGKRAARRIGRRPWLPGLRERRLSPPGAVSGAARRRGLPGQTDGRQDPRGARPNESRREPTHRSPGSPPSSRTSWWSSSEASRRRPSRPRSASWSFSFWRSVRSATPFFRCCRWAWAWCSRWREPAASTAG